MKLLLALAAAVAGSAPQQQFDLVCDGSSQGFPNDRPASTRYHADLAANTWCTGTGSDCLLKVIALVEPGVIWFKNDHRKFQGDSEWIEYVDRTSGKWVREIGPWVTEGSCKLAPFGGFSNAPTRF